jgi:hypothetical protein
LRKTSRTILGFLAAGALSCSLSFAEGLSSTYSGSSMATDGTSRLITLELSKDGTGVYQEHSGKGDVHKDIHWSRDGKTITVALRPEQGQTSSTEMVFNLKHKSLIPANALNTQLGALGFPVLHPFGPATVGNNSGMTTCVTGAPGPCAMRETWSSNKSQ